MLGVRRDALNRAVGHVDRRLAAACDGLHVGAFRDQVLDQLVVAARRGVMERRVAVVIARVDVGAQFLDQVLTAGTQPSGT